jgi:two-component system response regulator MprA
VSALAQAGFEPLEAATGNDALDCATRKRPSLVILDVRLPDLSGYEVCRELRDRLGASVPVMFVSGERIESFDRVAGLLLGADDYLAKPFELDELFARVRALLRRARTDDLGEHGALDTLQLGDLRIEPHARRVWRADREIELSKTEFDLLELLVRNQGIVLEHSTIYERIWGYDFGPDSKNLAVYISYLRRKLEQPGESKLIHTVRGVGYTVRVT